MADIGEIRKILKDHELRISELESKDDSENRATPSKSSKQIPSDILSLIGKNLDEIKISELIVLILKFYGGLTKEKQIEILKKLGKKEANSMRGGNYNRDIVSKGLVHKDKMGKGGICELSEKGKAVADLILKKLKEKK